VTPPTTRACPTCELGGANGGCADRWHAVQCAAKREHEPTCDPRGEDFWYCSDGRLYGPCEDERCGGVCEYKGDCECWCHDESETER